MPYTQISSVTPDTSANLNAPKIARSWRMAAADEASRVQENTDLSFGDVLDFINPLHHIPVIGAAYREVTGDEIKPAVQIAGDLLFGAVTGSVLLSGAASIATMVYEQQNGQEPTIQIAQALFGNDTVQPASEQAGSIQVVDSGNIGDVLLEKGTIQIAATEEKKPLQAELVVAQQSSEPLQKPAPAASESIHIGNMEFPRLSPKVTLTQAALQQNKTPAPMDSQTLGLMIHEQAEVQKAGNNLPPELVRDMMIMALDKYKTAQSAPESLSGIQ